MALNIERHRAVSPPHGGMNAVLNIRSKTLGLYIQQLLGRRSQISVCLHVEGCQMLEHVQLLSESSLKLGMYFS